MRGGLGKEKISPKTLTEAPHPNLSTEDFLELVGVRILGATAVKVVIVTVNVAGGTDSGSIRVSDGCIMHDDLPCWVIVVMVVIAVPDVVVTARMRLQLW